MRIFKNKWFSRFARREGLTRQDLRKAIEQAESGLIDADLGGGVIKQRIARPNEGKSGGFRSIILFRSRERAFFVYGFAKNERANISAEELKAFKLLAQEMLPLTDDQLQTALKEEVLTEVNCNEEEIQK